MAEQFTGKVAIVTGSSAGLGEAIALLFASQGASVTFCGRDEVRLRSVLDKAAKVSGGHKERFIFVQGDLTDKEVRKQIVLQTIEKFGRLDILVANAGIVGTPQPIVASTEENFDALVNTNLKSVYFLIQLAVPHLEKTRGNIVSISSAASTKAVPAVSINLMLKAALDHLTRCLAVELGPQGIRVNTVNPGYFPTLILREMPNAAEFESVIADLTIKSQPLKDRKGVVEDIAHAVSFLASDAAGFITGEQIKVDGGGSMGGSIDIPTEKV